MLLTTNFIKEIQDKYNRGERNFQNYDLKKVVLRGINLKEVNLSGVDFSYADLRDVDFSGANLRNCCFHGADLRNSNLSHTRLAEADLTDAMLNQSSLVKADCRKATFVKTHLTKANLENAYLNEANLNEACLNEANLSKANLKKVNLENAFLIGANLTQTYFNESDLSGAYLMSCVLDKTCFKGAKYDEKTKFKVGANPQELGMKKKNVVLTKELLDNINKLSKYSQKYLGSTISVKYWHSSRPECDWIKKFTIDDSGLISFSGSTKESVEDLQIKWYEQWINQYIKSCSMIIKGFENLIKEDNLIILNFNKNLDLAA